jgi:GNAT superfamily N-acetyltransferase
MIHVKRVTTEAELAGILSLQKQNLATALTQEEIQSQGFVTVSHSYDVLHQLNEIEPHILAKEDDRVIAYLLAMTEQSQLLVPVLQPMFDMFRTTGFAGKAVAGFHYLVVGQVCVDKAYRGKGILGQCYAFYRKTFQKEYDFAITEIAAHNLRSLAAHRRIGFQEIHRHLAPDGVNWVIVVWDWNNLSKERR